MVDISAIGASSVSGVARKSSPAEQSLGQADFLRLMIAQLQNQDPFQPMENGEFLGQMAQFSTVNGIEELKTSVNQMASIFAEQQLLGATSLIGREVMILSYGVQGGAAQPAAVDLPSSGPVRIRIQNSSGELVQTLDLGTRSAGISEFELPELPEGEYSVMAELGQGQSLRTLPILITDRIKGVSLSTDGSGATSLELARLGPAGLGDIYQFREETV